MLGLRIDAAAHALRQAATAAPGWPRQAAEDGTPLVKLCLAAAVRQSQRLLPIGSRPWAEGDSRSRAKKLGLIRAMCLQ
jgi:hypothetical protein